MADEKQGPSIPRGSDPVTPTQGLVSTPEKSLPGAEDPTLRNNALGTWPLHVVAFEPLPPDDPPNKPGPKPGPKPERRPAPAPKSAPKPPPAASESMEHLGLPFHRGTLTNPTGETALHSRDIPDDEIDRFDPSEADRKLIVLAYDRIRLHLLSPHVPLENKARLALNVLAQIQGTRKVVQWDKRVTSQRDLLLKSENLIEQIQKYRGVLPADKMAELEVTGIDAKIRAAMSDDDDREPS